MKNNIIGLFIGLQTWETNQREHFFSISNIAPRCQKTIARDDTTKTNETIKYSNHHHKLNIKHPHQSTIRVPAGAEVFSNEMIQLQEAFTATDSSLPQGSIVVQKTFYFTVCPFCCYLINTIAKDMVGRSSVRSWESSSSLRNKHCRRT